MQEILQSPWPWYIGGPLIGIMVPALLLWANRHFGISSSLDELCSYVLPKQNGLRALVKGDNAWSLLFVLGVLVGSWLTGTFFADPDPVQISEQTVTELQALGLTDFSGLMPSELYSWEALGSLKGLLMMVIGGVCVGFGVRYAGGCTSGHAIMGLSLLNFGSLVATIGFFIGGLIMVHFIYPFLFS